MNSLVSVSIGLAAGFLYGCSFALQQRSTFAFNDRKGEMPMRSRLKIMLNSSSRIALLAICAYALLRSGQISPILFFASFAVMFWLVVTKLRMCRRA